MSTFSQRLEVIYQESPNVPAIHLLRSQQVDETMTYQKLLLGSGGYARALEQAGIQPGEVVILILEHGTDLVYSFWGAILHGVVPSIMPFLTEKLSPEHYRASLNSLIEITAPAAIITDMDFLPEVRAAINSDSPVRKVLIAEEIKPEEKLNFHQFQGLQCEPDDIVLLQHSSGTTGLQKGVALSHRAVFNQLESYSKAINLHSGDVVVSWLPLYHDMGLIAGFILPVLLRIPLVLMSPFDWVRAPYRLMQAVSRYRGTLSWLPNFAYNFCAQKIREKDLDGVDLSSWRAVINCSEPMYLNSHQMFIEKFSPFGLHPSALATCYAMAENVFAVTQGGITEPIIVDFINLQEFTANHLAKPVQDGDTGVPMLSAGKVIEGVHVRVLDQNSQELPERHVGEIALQSNCMLTGYYNRPDITEKAFLDGWYLTGDLGYIAKGEVFITGRKKDLIIVGGKNVYPQDIEALVNEVPGVYPGRVSAFGVLNERSGTEDVVVIAEVETDDPQKRQYIADQIRVSVNKGSDIVLRFVELVDRNWLIKTSSGKVSRTANRQKYLELHKF